MRLLGVASFLLLMTAARPAAAGDPCPIGFVLIDLGVPDWASDELKKTVTPKNRFFENLAAVAKKQDCSEVTVTKLEKGRFPLKTYDGAKVDLTMKGNFDAFYQKNRGFRCSAAAKSLKKIDEASQVGVPVFVLRGHRRILLVTAGWKSTCIAAKDADALSEKKLLEIWKGVTGTYVKDRHDNP